MNIVKAHHKVMSEMINVELHGGATGPVPGSLWVNVTAIQLA